MYSASLLLALGLPVGSLAETVVGVYLFSRHGDRTPKVLGNTQLTDLGYQEVFERGSYYRERYVNMSSSANQIFGISASVPSFNQLSASAPYDDVLGPSALGWLQGLYPPVGADNFPSPLKNGSSVGAPLNGYQIIPVQSVQTGANSENSVFLQGQSDCANAIASSNEYLTTSQYTTLLNSTQSFYQSFTNLTNGSYSQSQMNFKNAYGIFDLFNVAEIHNQTFDPQDTLQYNQTDGNFHQIRTLADTHEFNLAYNASAPIRGIAGMTLAAQIVQGLNQTITTAGSKKFNIQFGPYGTMQSFFGLANLTVASPNFFGIPDYASSFSFELVTNSSASPFPQTSDLGVRFYFHNGTSESGDVPTPFPLFGQSDNLLSWSDFVSGMNKFAVYTQAQFCTACGNSTGVCAASTNCASSSSKGSRMGYNSGSHLSNAVAGVIGAMVTLGVILGLQLLAILIGGLRVVSKKRLNAAQINGKESM